MGQWVEFQLLKDVHGLELQNGFIRSLYKIEGKDLHTFYKKNNRVKQVQIVSDDKRISAAIALKDIKEMQYFHIFLPKGVYKLYIRDIYKGK